MTKKPVKEWTVEAPWGKIDVIAWGDASKPSVLLLHGYMDSAATFIPLMNLLPDDYYYIGFDFPGLGKSSHFPLGPLPTHGHLVEPMRLVLNHMGWDHFVCLTHSAGFVYATVYNQVYPGRITKIIAIDPAPAMPLYYYSDRGVGAITKQYYCEKYYNNYDSFYREPPAMPYKKAIKIIAKTRRISTEQAEVLMSRSLAPAGDGLVRFTWDSRMKSIPGVMIPEETQLYIFTTNIPPILFLVSSVPNYKGKIYEDYVNKLMEKIVKRIPGCTVLTVEGEHDVHITNPERLSPHIVDFLNRDVAIKSKL